MDEATRIADALRAVAVRARIVSKRPLGPLEFLRTTLKVLLDDLPLNLLHGNVVPARPLAW